MQPFANPTICPISEFLPSRGKGAPRNIPEHLSEITRLRPLGILHWKKGREGGIGEINDRMPVQSVGVEPLVYGTPHNTDHLSRIPLPQTAMLNKDLAE